MTDLQVKYQLAQEQMRANRAQEELKARDVAVKEQQLPHQIEQIVSQSNLNQAERTKILKEADNLVQELELIKARTDLTQTQKENELEKVVRARTENWAYRSGFGLIDQLIGAFLGSFKGAGTKALFN